ncbi:alpha/beta fold hydrolase [Aromatoleum bremense]|uniref:Alpha/beta fold hydrolase n=1 Tax=Aromatoleum bremense TaxID=76115 RepID=A0ABX1NSZ9_9RHOO|nr:alpha/beta hydrolase [Aromatoleum bremense]NMG15134.1 alpha/beta fold hydrolase [Aromatoleum bremense]QTQ31506.1 Alpha/beta hydrolase [Aromatoleum bremense]
MKTWIFLRGLTRETRHWGDFVDTFERIVPDARVVTIDLPGNGRLNHLVSPCSVREMATCCREALIRRGIAPPYNLLAMSLGAMVAVAWAYAWPGEVGRCVLINTSLRPFSPFHRRLRPDACLALLKLALVGGSAAEWEERILFLTSRLRGDAAKLLSEWAGFRTEHPVTRANVWRQLYAAARYRAPGEKPAAALLILASRNDALVHVGCSQDLAAAWNGELRIHPRAGHDLPLDDGQWVAAQVVNWLAARNPSS